jgi:tetratricopeptide (TPR) repeat protein
MFNLCNMRHLSIFLALILFSSCSSTFQDGEVYYKRGEFEKAISTFNKVLFLNVTDVKSLHLRARSYEEMEEYGKALKDYKTIIKYKPTYAHAHAGIGMISFKLKDYATAEKHLLLASLHDYKDYDILFYLGRAMIMNENYKSADEFLQLARDIKPREPMTYYYQGIARAKYGDPLGTASAFNMYVGLNPDKVEGLYNRGFAYMIIGMTSWAIEDFDQVLKKNPKHYEAMARRGACLMRTEPGKACQDLRLAANNGSQYGKEKLTQFCN